MALREQRGGGITLWEVFVSLGAMKDLAGNVQASEPSLRDSGSSEGLKFG